MNRRGFLQGILATGVAPAVFSSGIASGILMPVRNIVRVSIYPVDGIYEDIDQEMVRQIAERMALVRDMVFYEAIRGHSISPRVSAYLLGRRA